jgi:hypothetical protein
MAAPGLRQGFGPGQLRTMLQQFERDKTFFSGAHLGLTIDRCAAYYRNIGHVGILEHYGQLRGQRSFDFRSGSDPFFGPDDPPNGVNGASTSVSENPTAKSFQ